MREKGYLIYEKKGGFREEIPPSREEGIRTLDAVTHILPFQGSPFNHSGTSLC